MHHRQIAVSTEPFRVLLVEQINAQAGKVQALYVPLTVEGIPRQLVLLGIANGAGEADLQSAERVCDTNDFDLYGFERRDLRGAWEGQILQMLIDTGFRYLGLASTSEQFMRHLEEKHHAFHLEAGWVPGVRTRALLYWPPALLAATSAALIYRRALWEMALSRRELLWAAGVVALFGLSGIVYQIATLGVNQFGNWLSGLDEPWERYKTKTIVEMFAQNPNKTSMLAAVTAGHLEALHKILTEN